MFLLYMFSGKIKIIRVRKRSPVFGRAKTLGLAGRRILIRIRNGRKLINFKYIKETKK